MIVPFFTHASAVERLRGIVAALEGSAYDLVLFNVETRRHRGEHLASLIRRDRADGLLIMSLPPPRRALARLTTAGVPVVLIDARGPRVPSVVTDDVEGGRVATRHLVELGHERRRSSTPRATPAASAWSRSSPPPSAAPPGPVPTGSPAWPPPAPCPHADRPVGGGVSGRGRPAASSPRPGGGGGRRRPGGWRR